MRSRIGPGAVFLLLVAVAAGCRGSDEAATRGEAAQLAGQIEQVTGTAGGPVDPAAGEILCAVMAGALPQMEAHAGNPENPYGPSTAFRLHLEEVKEERPDDYEKILALQASDSEAADAATSRQCPQVRERVLELGGQQELFWLLVGSLS